MDGEELDLRALTDLVADRASPQQILRLTELRTSLQREKRELDEQVQAGLLGGAEFAKRTNELASSYLPRIASVIGEDNLREIFGVSSTDEIELLDPEQAATVSYQRLLAK